MPKTALILQGGWDGHAPRECAELFSRILKAQDYEVEVSDTLASLDDFDKIKDLSVIIPIWTMGQITGSQCANLVRAVAGGVGLAGFHGGMGDAFRDNTEFQYLVGGQFVSHPGGCQPRYAVNIVDFGHAVTRGIEDFDMLVTEQYYMHVDPSNHVLATTTFPNGVEMPAAWVRGWGDGRVFYASWGHSPRDFDVPEALELVKRGILWASR